MRPPRFRLRTLLIAVAVIAAALAVGAERTRRRWVHLREEAALHAEAERLWLQRAIDIESGRPTTDDVSNCRWEDTPANRFREGQHYRENAAHHARLKRSFERAAARPWLPVATAPPPPD
jgi:hypothetical protein